VSQDDKENHAGPIAALLAVQLLFGSLPVTAKFALTQIPPIALVGMRVGVAAAILVIFQLYRRRFWLRNSSDYLRLAILGLFGVVLNQLFSLLGISLTTASNASLLIVTIPIFTLLIGFLVGIERVTVIKVAGVAIALTGAILLIDPSKSSFSSQTTLGDAMIILNSLAFSIYVVTSKDVVTRNGAFRSMMWVFIFSSMICIPIGAYSLASIDVATVSMSTWLLVAYISVFATAAPYLLNAYAIARVSPGMVAVFIYLQPIIGFLLATMFLGETLTVKFFISTICIFTGVFLVSRRRNSEALHLSN
jgi:drug/metabolite transporter (DMT)-like permease